MQMLSSSSLLPKDEKRAGPLQKAGSTHHLQHGQNDRRDLKQAGVGGDLVLSMCEKLRFGTGCPMAAQRVGESYCHLKCVTAQPADVLLGSSFPQQSEQLQCETLGQLIFPPLEPDLCLLHRNVQPGHSWGRIWTETHGSHPGEGSAVVKDRCAPGADPQPRWRQRLGPSAQAGQAGVGSG